MNEETEKFVKDLTILKYNLVQQALRYKQVNPTTHKALIQHALNITNLIQRWKDLN